MSEDPAAAAAGWLARRAVESDDFDDAIELPWLGDDERAALRAADIDPVAVEEDELDEHTNRYLDDAYTWPTANDTVTSSPSSVEDWSVWSRPSAGGEAWDVPADLPPMQVPPGYVRDGRGSWRYTATGRPVPGARDVTLERLWRFGSSDAAVVHVPTALARTEETLAWCLDVTDVSAVVIDAGSGATATTAVAVPRHEWDRRAQVPLGITAPELDASRVLDIDAVAALARVSRQTISTYLARGYMPEPAARVGNSPVWSRPVVDHWLVTRPGQGRRPPRRGPRRR